MRKIGLTLTLLVILFVSNQKLQAQTPVLIKDAQFQTAAKAAIDSLYNRNPEAAEDLLKSWKDSLPNHPVWPLFEAMDFWWIVLTDLFDESHDEKLFDMMKQADLKAVELLAQEPGHPDGLIVRAVANGYIARHLSNRDQWMKSILTARKAHSAHVQLGDAAPDLADNLLAEGLKKYYAEYLPEAYPLVRTVTWFLPEGDKQEGLALLEETSRKAVFARPEALYFLGNILLNYEQEYSRAIRYFHQLVSWYPNNSYYRRLLVRAMFQQGEYHQGERTIRETLAYWKAHELPDDQVLREEMLYWRGRINMRLARYEEAYGNFQQSFELGRDLPGTGRRSFHVLSGYYAGVSAERRNQLNTARTFYEAIDQYEAEPDVRRRARERLSEL
ncbi:MAG: hypothetical protein WD035_09040 [Balneolaceae bacterium]